MTALRQTMIEVMRQRGFAQRTHTTYLMVITDLVSQQVRFQLA